MGDDLTWRREGHRAQDSPLKLARRKAVRLKSKLNDELYRWAQENNTRIPDARDVIPFVKQCVFLHHPDFRCALTQNSRIDLFGLDDHESEHGIGGISVRLLESSAQASGFTSRSWLSCSPGLAWCSGASVRSSRG